MRAFIVILIIAAAAGGWYWHKKHQKPAMETGDPVIPMTGTPGLSPSGTAAGSTAAGTGSDPGLGQGTLPSEAKQTLDQAEALWAQAGADPATSAKAPEMAALYSGVLRSLYNQVGLASRENSLISDRLAPLGAAMFFSKAKYPDDASGIFAVHVAAAGESPNVIARKYGMSQQFLNRLRGHEANDGKLAVGEVLKVVKVKDKGGFAIHVDKGDYILDCYVAGLFAKRYKVSVGKRESPTPVGRTHLIGREWHPDWTDPTSHLVMRYGDPGNILGPIWMKFDPAELGQDGIGIHGYTGTDSKIGEGASHGCVRLDNLDAEELYNTLSQPDLAPTAVDITE